MLDRVSSNTAGLAIKTGYFLLAAMALVFVVMLILTDFASVAGAWHRHRGRAL